MSKRTLDANDEASIFLKRTQRVVEGLVTPTEPLSFCHISKLSDEIFLHIFELLPLEQILLCQQVSHRWQKISTDTELWKKLYFTCFVKPRLAHVISRSRTRIAARDWWSNETTQQGQTRKDWKKLFKLRHNWHKGRCAISELDISNSLPYPTTFEPPSQRSFWEEAVPSVWTPLVQFDGTIFVAVDKSAGLKAWDIGRIENGMRKLVGSWQFQKYEQGWQLGTATALALDSDEERIDVAVGFESGGAMILQLQPAGGVDGEDFGFSVRFILPPNSASEEILHLTYSHPYLLTLDSQHCFRAYLFDSSHLNLDRPQLLATLQAQALQGPCRLTMRKPKNGVQGRVTASIAYSMPLFHGGWSVGIQEVVLDCSSPNGIAHTRIGTCIPSTYALTIHPGQPPSHVHSVSIPVASPTSISYSHPYLLTSHLDNTLTLYLARSNDKEITIGQPRRLWGHTTGVARAGVAGRGRAVSVSQVGGEVRVWELESIAARASKADTEIEDGTVVGIIESVRVENASGPKVGKELYLDNIPAKSPMSVDWIGFDEERVLVITSGHTKDKNVTMYDFTF